MNPPTTPPAPATLGETKTGGTFNYQAPFRVSHVNTIGAAVADAQNRYICETWKGNTAQYVVDALNASAELARLRERLRVAEEECKAWRDWSSWMPNGDPQVPGYLIVQYEEKRYDKLMAARAARDSVAGKEGT